MNNEQVVKSVNWYMRSEALRERIGWEEETQHFLEESESHFVFYATDTDIIMCYTAPDMIGVGKKKEDIPYGIVFPPDADVYGVPAAITEIIAHYIFFELDSSSPIFQMPQHASETERVYAAVSGKVQHAQHGIENILEQFEFLEEKLESKIDLDITSINTQEDAIKQIKSLAEKLEKEYLKYKSGPGDELYRYLKLLTSGALIDTNDVFELYGSDEEGGFRAFAAEGIHDWVKEFDYKDRWMKLLMKGHKGAGKARTINIEDDAYALARLELINDKLKPMGGRLILITGTKNIISAAKKRGDRFLEKYIRHFHSFAPQAFYNIEKDNKDREGSTRRFYDVLGTKFLPSGKETEEQIEQEQTKLEEEWTEYRDAVIRSSSLSKLSSQQKILQALNSIKNNSYTKNELQEKLQEVVNQMRLEIVSTRMSFLFEIVDMGLKRIMDGERDGARNPPIIVFDSYKNARTFFETLVKRSDNPEELKNKLKKISEDCLDKKIGITDYGYLYFLVASSVYASLNRWSDAAFLAFNAITVAKSKPKTIENSHISGREAYYLFASAQRISAKNISDFETARQNLKKALEALEEDKKDRPALAVNELRFKAEDLAIDISEYHFKSSKDTVVSIEEKRIDEVHKVLLDIENDRYEFSIISIQYAVNGLQLISLILQQKKEDREIAEFIEIYKDKIDTFHEKTNTEHEVRETYLIKSYRLFAKILLKEDTVSLYRINKEFKKGRPREFSSGYDKDRYEKLEKQCEKIYNIVNKTEQENDKQNDY